MLIKSAYMRMILGESGGGIASSRHEEDWVLNVSAIKLSLTLAEPEPPVNPTWATFLTSSSIAKRGIELE